MSWTHLDYLKKKSVLFCVFVTKILWVFYFKKWLNFGVSHMIGDSVCKKNFVGTLFQELFKELHSISRTEQLLLSLSMLFMCSTASYIVQQLKSRNVKCSMTIQSSDTTNNKIWAHAYLLISYIYTENTLNGLVHLENYLNEIEKRQKDVYGILLGKSKNLLSHRVLNLQMMMYVSNVGKRILSDRHSELFRPVSLVC